MFSKAANGDAEGDMTETEESGEGDFSSNSEFGGSQRYHAPVAPGSSEENAFEVMTMAEIMCGKGDYFPGLMPLINAYLDNINCDKATRDRLETYLNLIERRAKGELVTPATWMRNFVRNHPAYKNDSVVSDEIAYDLMIACRDIGLGRLHVPELLGDVAIEPVTTEGAYEVKLESQRVQNSRLLALLRRYKNRQSFSGRVHTESSTAAV